MNKSHFFGEKGWYWETPTPLFWPNPNQITMWFLSKKVGIGRAPPPYSLGQNPKFSRKMFWKAPLTWHIWFNSSFLHLLLLLHLSSLLPAPPFLSQLPSIVVVLPFFHHITYHNKPHRWKVIERLIQCKSYIQPKICIWPQIRFNFFPGKGKKSGKKPLTLWTFHLWPQKNQRYHLFLTLEYRNIGFCDAVTPFDSFAEERVSILGQQITQEIDLLEIEKSPLLDECDKKGWMHQNVCQKYSKVRNTMRNSVRNTMSYTMRNTFWKQMRNSLRNTGPNIIWWRIRTELRPSSDFLT